MANSTEEAYHGYLWMGVALRPSRDLSGRFVAFAVDVDFKEGQATLVPNVRVGWAGFHDRKAWLPIIQSYFIIGLGWQQFEGRPKSVMRVGSGFCIPWMLRAAEFGVAIPSTIEVTVDVGAPDTAVTLRLGWGF